MDSMVFLKCFVQYRFLVLFYVFFMISSDLLSPLAKIELRPVPLLK